MGAIDGFHEGGNLVHKRPGITGIDHEDLAWL
jgi:hypothetical protein